MEATQIIIKPIITEKSTIGSESHRYTFLVDSRADKPQIRSAVQELYNVRVISVNTVNRKGQLRRNKNGYWKTKAMKQAIIRIHPEDQIELF